LGEETKGKAFSGKALERVDSDDTALGETDSTVGEKAESSSTFKHKGKGKAAKEASKGPTKKRSVPRARPKKGKETPEGGTSSVQVSAQAVAKSAVTTEATKTGARPVTEHDAARERMSRLTLEPRQSEQVEAPLQEVAGASSMVPQKDADGYPPNPKTMADLPQDFHLLENALPKYHALPVDMVESNEEDTGGLALADKLDFLTFIKKRIDVAKQHRKSINPHENGDLCAEIDKRLRMLDWYYLQYARLRDEEPSARNDEGLEGEPMLLPKEVFPSNQELGQAAGMDLDDAEVGLGPMVGHLEGMEVDLPEHAPPSK